MNYDPVTYQAIEHSTHRRVRFKHELGPRVTVVRTSLRLVDQKRQLRSSGKPIKPLSSIFQRLGL